MVISNETLGHGLKRFQLVSRKQESPQKCPFLLLKSADDMTRVSLAQLVNALLFYANKENPKHEVSEVSSVGVHSICLTVFLTAVRSSRRRQQYNIGLIDEFI